MGLTIPPNAQAASGVPSAASKRLLPWLVAVAFFMESLDTTILNTAVPAVSAALHVTPLAMKAVLASYTLALAVFIPISGWMADRFGTRIVFASAIGMFTLGSLLCGLCSNIHMLVFCRIIQGVGGLIVHYLHWRLIFFVNLPIGLLGLVLVYLHLPDFREPKTPPLDIVGLILFGSGIGLFSYVLEVFGEHALSVREIFGLLGLAVALI